MVVLGGVESKEWTAKGSRVSNTRTGSIQEGDLQGSLLSKDEVQPLQQLRFASCDGWPSLGVASSTMVDAAKQYAAGWMLLQAALPREKETSAERGPRQVRDYCPNKNSKMFVTRCRIGTELIPRVSVTLQ